MTQDEITALRKLVAKDLLAEAKNERRRAAEMAKQRDKWRGIAAEYKGYATRYQKELAALRTEVKQLRATVESYNRPHLRTVVHVST